MSLVILARSRWGAKPAQSFTVSDPKKLKGVVCHWFGVPSAKKDHKDCPALLRSVQRAHQAGEFTDIAYNHAVCQHGVVYALRGFDRQTGANGNKTANRSYAAVVAMIGEGDKPSGELKNALAEVIREWRRRGAGSEVLPHGAITGSACPGPELTAWVRVKAYEPRPPVRKPRVRPEPVKPSTTIPAQVEWQIDVSAGSVTLKDQNPSNPVVVSRLERLKSRFKTVNVLWKRK